PPARLTRGCGPCEWYLLTPAPPQSLLLRRDSCHAHWSPVTRQSGSIPAFENGVAVAAWHDYVAIADAATQRVVVLAQKGHHLFAEIPVPDPGPLAFAPNGYL